MGWSWLQACLLARPTPQMWLPQDLSETVTGKLLSPTLRKQNLLQWSLETWLPLLTQWSSNCGLQTQALPQLEAARNAGSRALQGVVAYASTPVGCGEPWLSGLSAWGDGGPVSSCLSTEQCSLLLSNAFSCYSCFDRKPKAAKILLLRSCPSQHLSKVESGGGPRC